jgi:protein-disulfide isomerase
MKFRSIAYAAAAVLALAGCDKNKNGTGTATPANDSVVITQQNPPPGGTWADVVNATSDGFMMGNPNAKVKLVEIASLGCPFCKRFDEEGAPHLVEYVKTGQMSWEFRPYLIHGPIDMAAQLIVRCNGAKSFFPLMLALYKDQSTWIGKVESAPQDKLTQMQDLPTDKVFVAFAQLAGLQDWAAARGVPQAKSSQCLSDQKMIDHEVQVTTNVNNQYPDFKGTPSFVIDGKLLPDTGTWEKLKPELEAALRG